MNYLNDMNYLVKKKKQSPYDQFSKSYSYHKEHYWKRKLKNFNLNLLDNQKKLSKYHFI